MPVYRYRADFLIADQISDYVDGPIVVGRCGPSIFQDVTADVSSKSDLDQYMHYHGWVFVQEDPDEDPEDKATSDFVRVITHAITLPDLNAGGVGPSVNFDVSSVLPEDARVLRAEVICNEAISGPSIVSALGSLQATTDDEGSMLNGIDLLVPGSKAPPGKNPYTSRGLQQLQLKITLAGSTFTDLTAGDLTVNVYYSRTRL
jgi:hypothetical protein